MALTAALVVAPAVQAAGKKKPVPATLYFHGTETIGEIDLANNFAAGYNRMDTTKPADAVPKSLQFTTWAGERPA